MRETRMNATSSRSHCIVTLLVKRKVRLERAGGGGGGAREHMARLVLVDLAGNERDSAREGACVSPLKASSITSAQTLQYATLVKRIKTDAEDSAMLLEEGLNLFPIEFIPHASLVQRGAIARSSEGITVYLNELRVVVVKVFISHRWLSPSATPLLAHPDKVGEDNPKHRLVCECVNKIVSARWIRSSDMLEIVEWIDFACINQDSHNPAEQLNGSMGRIIGSCDVMITPVHDPMWQEWAHSGGGKRVVDAFEDYGAIPFHDYLKR